MAKIDLASREWVELVFEGRNKLFGAYEMRNNTARRHNTAMLIVVVAALLAFTLPALIKSVIPEKEQKEVITDVATLSNLEDVEVKKEPEPIKPDIPPPPPLKSSVKFVPPVIAKDDEVNEEEQIKSQDDLNQTDMNISTADVVGTDEVNGADIADLQVIAEEPKVEDDNKIYDNVEQPPMFPGGDEAMYKWLKENLDYPTMAQESGIKGRVIVRFAVMKDGSISNITISRKVDPALDQEAIRLVKNMPKWTAGKQNGNPVNVYYSLPVVFLLRN